MPGHVSPARLAAGGVLLLAAATAAPSSSLLASNEPDSEIPTGSLSRLLGCGRAERGGTTWTCAGWSRDTTPTASPSRPEERRVGQEGVSPCKSLGSPAN